MDGSGQSVVFYSLLTANCLSHSLISKLSGCLQMVSFEISLFHLNFFASVLRKLEKEFSSL
jgi:hypothetical protein